MPKTEPFEKHHRECEEWFIRNKYVYESEVEAMKRPGFGDFEFAQTIFHSLDEIRVFKKQHFL